MKMRALKIRVDDADSVSAELLTPSKPGGAPLLALAHGAGNDMHNPFLSSVCKHLADGGIATLRFNFPYKEKGRKAPDRAPKLEATWRAVLTWAAGGAPAAIDGVFVGGKSLGGRMASRVVAKDWPGVAGLVLLGYPLHPASKPEKPRTDHFPAIRVPSLFVQGTRDGLCDLALLEEALPRLGAGFTLHVVAGGDHSFNVPKHSGVIREAVWEDIATAVAAWIAGIRGR